MEKMIIKKRFGDRNFVQYLGLQNDDYALVPKKKKKKTEYIPGVSVTYRNDPGSQAELEAQQSANSVRFIPHKYEDQRAYRYTAKALPPVVHSYDRLAFDRSDAIALKEKHMSRDKARERIFRLMKLKGAREWYKEEKRYGLAAERRYERALFRKAALEERRREGEKKQKAAEKIMKVMNRFGENIKNAKQSYKENKAATKIQSLTRMKQAQATAHEQKQWNAKLDKTVKQSLTRSGLFDPKNGKLITTTKFDFGPLPEGPVKFSVGTAPQTPKVQNRKRTRLDPTPTGIWSPNTPVDDNIWYKRPEIRFVSNTPVV